MASLGDIVKTLTTEYAKTPLRIKVMGACWQHACAPECAGACTRQCRPSEGSAAAAPPFRPAGH